MILYMIYTATVLAKIPVTQFSLSIILQFLPILANYLFKSMNPLPNSIADFNTCFNIGTYFKF